MTGPRKKQQDRFSVVVLFLPSDLHSCFFVFHLIFTAFVVYFYNQVLSSAFHVFPQFVKNFSL